MVATVHIPVIEDVVVSQLDPGDWQRYRCLRLDALATDPQAFEASYEEQRVRPDAYWQERLHDAASRKAWMLFARQEQRLVGTIGALPTEERSVVHITGVYGVREARGRGVGKALIGTMLHELSKDRVIRCVRLYVNASQMAAVRLYEGAGFQVIRNERSTYGDGNLYDEYLMEKPLAWQRFGGPGTESG